MLYDEINDWVESWLDKKKLKKTYDLLGVRFDLSMYVENEFGWLNCYEILIELL